MAVRVGKRWNSSIYESGDSLARAKSVSLSKYDHGPIIPQRQVWVHPTDTSNQRAPRLFVQECIAYPEAIRLFAEDRIRLADGKVTILDD